MEHESRTRDGRVAAVVLAAGASRRMGMAKALLNFRGEPMIRRVVRTCVESEVIDRIVVVTGHLTEPIIRALDGFDVTFAHNPSADETGMIGSVKIGVGAIGDDSDGVLIVLGDQPLVRTETIRRLAKAFDGRIVRPTYQGNSGHPTLIPARLFSEILALPQGRTLKHFIDKRITDCVDIDVADPGVRIDIDTPQDLQETAELIERSESCEEAELAHPQPG